MARTRKARVRVGGPTNDQRLRELALFAGAGGGLLTTEHLLGWRTVCAVEINPYRREVLLRRQRDGMLDLFPIWDDAKTFDGRPWRGCVDVVSGGFPCQPFSVAGKRGGEDDARNMWPETIRIILEVQPRFAFLENVPGLLCPIHDKETGKTAPSYLGRVLGDLAEGGYDCQWRMLSAAEVGAPHLRKRLWIVAYAKYFYWKVCLRERIPRCNLPEDRRSRGTVEGGLSKWPPIERDESRWNQIIKIAKQPILPGVANGMACRMDRLAALGDGQVPLVAATAWRLLTEGLDIDP